MTFSYYIFRLFARPEEYLSKIIPLYCYEKSSAVGVVRFFVSAGVAGGDRATAVQSAAGQQSARHIRKPKRDIVGQKRERKRIVRLKISVGWD